MTERHICMAPFGDSCEACEAEAIRKALAYKDRLIKEVQKDVDRLNNDEAEQRILLGSCIETPLPWRVGYDGIGLPFAEYIG